MPECCYCDTTHPLRLYNEGAMVWLGESAEYICEECFVGQDDGPCWDDYPLCVEPKPETGE